MSPSVEQNCALINFSRQKYKGNIRHVYHLKCFQVRKQVFAPSFFKYGSAFMHRTRMVFPVRCGEKHPVQHFWDELGHARKLCDPPPCEVVAAWLTVQSQSKYSYEVGFKPPWSQWWGEKDFNIRTECFPLNERLSVSSCFSSCPTLSLALPLAAFFFCCWAEFPKLLGRTMPLPV